MGVFFLVCEMILIFLCSLNFVLGKGNPLALVPPVVIFCKFLGCASSLSLSLSQFSSSFGHYIAVLCCFASFSLPPLHFSLLCVSALTKLCRCGMCIFLLHGTSLFVSYIDTFNLYLYFHVQYSTNYPCNVFFRAYSCGRGPKSTTSYILHHAMDVSLPWVIES